MSTRARVGIKEGKKGKSVYVHNSGYPENMLEILNEYYTDENKIEKLMELGNCSSLNEKLEPKGNHTFDEPEESVTVFYGRDRGEYGQEAKDFQGEAELEKQAQDELAEYIYLYNKETKKWDYKEVEQII